MAPMDSQHLDLDLHRLDLRFAESRLVEPRAVERLARSIERCGQIVPCVVVAVPSGSGAAGERLVLIDGYRRIAALRRIGRDTASVERWACDVTDALLGLLARTQNRPFASIEEALLMRELMQGLGLSQHDLARRCGRDVSWVSRRLQLLSGLPDAALTAVREGRLSSWAANRVVVPLARANGEHADRLLAGLADAPLSTRELHCWFEHYQKAFRSAREHMVNRPLAGDRRAARGASPARRTRRRLRRRSAMHRGGPRSPEEACGDSAPVASDTDRGRPPSAGGHRRADHRDPERGRA
jgi:ParB family transcriptional regulator, chromosome partitioning protein